MSQDTFPTVDPLTSQDGTPITVEKIKEQGEARTQDEKVIDLLTKQTRILVRILGILEMEFELNSENLSDVEDVNNV